MVKKKAKPASNVIANNKRAKFDYELSDFIEGGLVLLGSEVKSIRLGHADISEAYAIFQNGEMFLLNANIRQYSNAAGYFAHEERRTRKILLHKKEIERMMLKKEQQSLTMVPTKLYWKEGKVKIEIALAKGKKLHDKRASIKERDWNRQKHRVLKG